jgi:predicted MFS family arabinose efflux permease
MATLFAQLISTVGSGLLASVLGWRIVLFSTGVMAGVAALITIRYLKPRANVPRAPFTIAGMRLGYAAILANPRARVSYAAVFLEGLVIFGVAPFIAVLLEQRGAGGVREAGFVIAGIGIGGLAYTLVVQRLLAALGGMLNMMRTGGFVCGAGLALLSLGLSWPKEMAACFLLGFGFFMLHNSLQTQATEIAPRARGSAVALFAFFFFLGSALGPVLYGLGIARIGSAATFLIAGSVMAALGLGTALGFARAAARDP